MLGMTNWRARVERELVTADAARTRGNEGMARVCARRAAGWAAEAYLADHGVDLQTTSVLEQLRGVLRQESVDPRAQAIIGNLLMPKKKDDLESDSYFPLDVDLIAEARELMWILFS
jgi:hypothetical protein